MTEYHTPESSRTEDAPGKSPSGTRIVVVGGGVAGLTMASSLARQAMKRKLHVSVVLIDREATHIWKPMLHTVAAGTGDVSQEQVPYVSQARLAGFTYHPGEATSVDREKRRVWLAPLESSNGEIVVESRSISYDVLILAVGSEANDFGTPGASSYCLRINSLEQAKAFNDEVRKALFRLAVQSELSLGIAIVGGGATGVELAAELCHLVQEAEAYGARGLYARVKVTLIEAGQHLLSGFPETIALAARTVLADLGVEVFTGTRVVGATESGLSLEGGESLACDIRVWAAGIKAPSVVRDIAGLERNASHQVVVTRCLQATVDERIYAIGDCASFTPESAPRPLPPTAQVAEQQAKHLIRHLLPALCEGAALPAFAFRDFGSIVTLSHYDAFASLGRLGFFKYATFKGRLAQLSHALLYRRHQMALFGVRRGVLAWIVGWLNDRLRSSIRLD